MVSRDKNKNFPNQLTDFDVLECAALAVTDVAGNIDGRLYNPDYTYAATIFLEGVPPGEQGTDPWVAVQSAVAYGLLPIENALFTAKTKGEFYASNWANYPQSVRTIALQHQQVAPKNLGLDYDAVVAYMQTTGYGTLLTMTWYASFTTAGVAGLPFPTGSTTSHCVAAYLGDDNETIYIKPWLGSTWGQQGYVPFTRQMFNTVLQRAYAFDTNGSHWWAILTIASLKLPYLLDYLPALSAPTMPETPIDIEHTDTMYPDWNTTAHARHNVRVVCDLEGLTVDQKNILTACVANESGFLTHPKPNQNKDKNGVVWSTDWGIVQVNDYWNIGAGKQFPSVQYVLDNPEACVRWMARYYKQQGNLGEGSSGWASYTSGAYKHYL